MDNQSPNAVSPTIAHSRWCALDGRRQMTLRLGRWRLDRAGVSNRLRSKCVVSRKLKATSVKTMHKQLISHFCATQTASRPLTAAPAVRPGETGTHRVGNGRCCLWRATFLSRTFRLYSFLVRSVAVAVPGRGGAPLCFRFVFLCLLGLRSTTTLLLLPPHRVPCAFLSFFRFLPLIDPPPLHLTLPTRRYGPYQADCP